MATEKSNTSHLVCLCLLLFGFTAQVDAKPRASDHEQSVSGLERSKRDISATSPYGNRTACGDGATLPPNRVDTTLHLSRLRALFDSEQIDAYIIPSEDAHQSEYPPDYDKRRGYISGFSGSAGLAVVTRYKAALWTDGRYFLQADDQLDCNWILMRQKEKGVPSVTGWLKQELADGGKVGASPFLLKSRTWLSYEVALMEGHVSMIAVSDELVDRIWGKADRRPAQPNTVINALDIKFTGKSWEEKLKEVREEMKERNVSALIATGLDETAWLFNLRASDIQYNPFFLSYAIIEEEDNRTRLYIRDMLTKVIANSTDNETIDTLSEHLHSNSEGACVQSSRPCVELVEYDRIIPDVESLVSDSKVWISPGCNYAIYSKIPKERIKQALTPMSWMKAQKNPIEVQGMKNAHVRDAVALIRCISKLESEVQAGRIWTEVSASEDLANYRRMQQYNRGLSFETIAGSGSNGAVIHYEPTNQTNKQITTTDVYLVDSGGQYLDGTTDVTRTFHFGKPNAFEKECYTRVLMGAIDLAMAIWPRGLLGRQIDILARRHLFNVGLNYRHGTGHGIGAYLSVHEGPGFIGLSHSSYEFDYSLEERQFFSDEPGFYEDGKFGIRHETILMVTRKNTKYTFGDTEFLGFEPITLVPFEPHLIDYSLLEKSQIAWLNNYHRLCLEKVGPTLKQTGDIAAYQWLELRTKPYAVPGCYDKETSDANRLLSFTLLRICFTCIAYFICTYRH